jgi:hypothetical protein
MVPSMALEERNALTPQQFKVLENRLRRMATRQGLRLSKSRSRDTRALDYGTYGLANATTNDVVAGDINTGYGLSLDEIEHALTS